MQALYVATQQNRVNFLKPRTRVAFHPFVTERWYLPSPGPVRLPITGKITRM